LIKRVIGWSLSTGSWWSLSPENAVSTLARGDKKDIFPLEMSVCFQYNLHKYDLIFNIYLKYSKLIEYIDKKSIYFLR